MRLMLLPARILSLRAKGSNRSSDYRVILKEVS